MPCYCLTTGRRIHFQLAHFSKQTCGATHPFLPIYMIRHNPFRKCKPSFRVERYAFQLAYHRGRRKIYARIELPSGAGRGRGSYTVKGLKRELISIVSSLCFAFKKHPSFSSSSH